MFNKKNTIIAVIVVVIVVAIVAAAFLFKGSSAPVENSQVKENVKAQEISVDDDPYLGSEDAPITMVEFSDFQCPYCARFYADTFSQIKQDYIDTGKVKLVYRDFPLSSIHPYAEKAAEAAECADEQGKFWEYSDLLFQNQSDWNTVGADKFKEYAVQLALNEEEFNSCLDSGQMAQEIVNDVSEGRQYGVTGTPTFFLNGEVISGAQPYTVFKQKIDSLLQ